MHISNDSQAQWSNHKAKAQHQKHTLDGVWIIRCTRQSMVASLQLNCRICLVGVIHQGTVKWFYNLQVLEPFKFKSHRPQHHSNLLLLSIQLHTSYPLKTHPLPEKATNQSFHRSISLRCRWDKGLNNNVSVNSTITHNLNGSMRQNMKI